MDDEVRCWGEYHVVCKGTGFKVKKLTVLPQHSLSYQRHFKRAEHWLVVSGTATVAFQSGDQKKRVSFGPNEHFYILKGGWHQLINETDQPLEVIEVATGDYIEEDDIERVKE